MRRIIIASVTSVLLLSLVAVCAFPWDGLTLVERWSELHSGEVVYSGSRHGRVVALTFDDGPDPRYTGRILDILKADHVHATFFVVGKRVEEYPDLARRIASEGHVLGNHTETHDTLATRHEPFVRDELDQCEDRIEQVTGERTYLFRPPRGEWNPATFRDACRDGYHIVLWSLAFDRHAVRNPDVLRRRVVRLARPGDIILLHDGSASKQDERGSTVRELDGLIAGLRHRGFRFATVPELIHTRGDIVLKRRA